MQENTALATLFPSSSSHDLNFNAFLKCKTHLKAKDEIIATSIAKKILGTLDSHQKYVRILDVGSAEGTLIRNICSKLVQNTYHKARANVHVSVDCVEPCIEGIARLQMLAAASSEIYMQPYQTTIENFLNNRKSPYDAIVCCHTLYHTERENWVHVLKGLIYALRPRGLLIVNLVSRKSEIYHIKNELERKTGFGDLPKLYTSYGFEYYAEDLEDVLYQLVDKLEQDIISTEIAFTKREVSAAISALQGKTNNSSLLHFLAFMFRLRYNDLKTFANAKLLNLLIRNTNGIAFKSIDEMFVLKKNYSR